MTDTKGVAPTPTASPTELATNPLSSILSSAYDPYGDILKELTKPKQLTTDQMAAQALLTLLPIAIGAATRGGSGAAIGAQSGVTGLGYLLGKQDEQEKRELTLKMAGAQTKSILERSMLSSGMAAGRQVQLEELRQKHREDLLRKKQTGGLDAIVTPSEWEEVFPGKEYPETPPSWRVVNAATANKGMDIKVAQAIVQAGDAARRADVSANDLQSTIGAGNLTFYSLPPDKGKSIAELNTAKLALDEIMGKMEAGYQKFIKEGGDARKWTDSDAFKQRALEAYAVIEYKNLQKMGANFTVMEKDLTVDALGTFDGFFNWLGKKFRGYDPVATVQASKALYDKIFDLKIAPYAYTAGKTYDRDFLSKFPKIPVDANGVAQPGDNNLINQVLTGLRDTAKIARNQQQYLARRYGAVLPSEELLPIESVSTSALETPVSAVSTPTPTPSNTIKTRNLNINLVP